MIIKYKTIVYTHSGYCSGGDISIEVTNNSITLDYDDINILIDKILLTKDEIYKFDFSMPNYSDIINKKLGS